MKTTILATALMLAAIDAGPAVAQVERADSAPTVAAAGAARRDASPAEPADDPKAADDASKAATQDDDDPDQDVNTAQPDYTIVALPTTLRMPKGKFAFRVTHRFGRPLDDGNFGDLAADLFGLDAGGLIGLELRYGLFKGSQIGVLRTSDRTIQLFAQQQIVGQETFPVVLGVGARIRVSRRTYLVAEAAPRLAGYDPGSTHASLGVEMRAGGHAFQLNFSRGLATTMGQVARGGSQDDWFIGFNISRKFW